MSDKDIEQVARAILDTNEKSIGQTFSQLNKEMAKAAIDTLKSLGWLSPADATAMAQAAMADMKERAATKAQAILDDDMLRYSGSSVTIVGTIPHEIRALTPSSGPWQRVPEGYILCELMMVQNAVKVLRDSADMKSNTNHMLITSDRLQEQITRAMLAEVKK